MTEQLGDVGEDGGVLGHGGLRSSPAHSTSSPSHRLDVRNHDRHFTPNQFVEDIDGDHGLFLVRRGDLLDLDQHGGDELLEEVHLVRAGPLREVRHGDDGVEADLKLTSPEQNRGVLADLHLLTARQHRTQLADDAGLSVKIIFVHVANRICEPGGRRRAGRRWPPQWPRCPAGGAGRGSPPSLPPPPLQR